MNILIISQEFSEDYCGGAGVYVLELIKALSARKDLKIVLMAPGKSKRRENKKKNYSIYWQKSIFKPLLKVPSFFFNSKKNIGSILEEEKIDLVHSNGNPGVIYSGIVPMVATLHHPVFYDFKSFGFFQKIISLPDLLMEKKIIKKAKKIICVSELSKKLLVQDNPLEKKKFRLVLEGVDTSLFRKAQFNIRKKYKIGKNNFLIFFPGGARSRRKGAEVLFESIRFLKKEGISIKCIASGETREVGWNKELRRIVEEKGLTKDIIFTGELRYSVLPKYYSNSDAVAFPSLFEGFGIPILESMACENIIIASRTGAAEEIILDGKDGYLVDVGDSLGLCQTIKKVIGDRKKAVKIGKAARKKIIRSYSWGRIADKYVQVYKETLKESA